MPRRKKSIGFVEAIHNMLNAFGDELTKETNMPKGQGTYGKKRGRPPKKKTRKKK